MIIIVNIICMLKICNLRFFVPLHTFCMKKHRALITLCFRILHV